MNTPPPSTPAPTPVSITRVGVAMVPTEWGPFRCVAYRDDTDGCEHLAFTVGDLGNGEPALTRVHSECLTGDVFGSRRCDCGPQLGEAMRRIAAHGRGVLVYLRGHEGRGIGIAEKIRAYALQDDGRDTVDANLELGHEVDTRNYAPAAAILRDLGVTEVRLITNNPAKCYALAAHGVRPVERVPVRAHVTPENESYLRTKRQRMGHLIEL